MSAIGKSIALLRLRLLAIAERRLPALTRLRAPEPLPILLHRRRIYVLPTFFGFGFSILLLIMQLGALNYSNNPALLLTCLLASAAWMSLYVGFRTMAGLQLVAITAAECHAGEAVSASLRFAASTRRRANIRLKWAAVESAFAIESGIAADTNIKLPCGRRGWMRPGRLKLSTDQPLGLFVIWSWLNPEVIILVYPAPELSPPPFPMNDQHQGKRLVAGDGDEYAGLRNYRSGDPQRQIAWKASARHDSLLVRESERETSDDLCFDFSALPGLDHEARISRLTAWVLAADVARLSYTVALFDLRIGPGIGESHRHACLRALALLPDAT